MNKLTEQELIDLGCYCEQVLNDPRFNNLVEVCVQQFSNNILETEKTEERESLYFTYQGLKAFLALIMQFVTIKDQIAEKQNQEQEDRE